MSEKRLLSGLYIVETSEPVVPSEPTAVCCVCGKESFEPIIKYTFLGSDTPTGFCSHPFSCRHRPAPVTCNECYTKCPVCGCEEEYT